MKYYLRERTEYRSREKCSLKTKTDMPQNTERETQLSSGEEEQKQNDEMSIIYSPLLSFH